MDVAPTPAPGGDAAPVELPPAAVAPAPDKDVSLSQAGRLLSKWRHERDKEKPAEESAQPAAPEVETETPPVAEADNAAPQVEEPGAEPTEVTEPEAEKPSPIEPPRSWTKEEKEEFKSYPREAQEIISRREQERERSVRRSQNEAAEQEKSYKEKLTAVEQSRQHYEAALPILLENLTSQQAGEFADIKSMNDVTRMASEDFPRYARWDAWQKQMAAVQQEIKTADERKRQEAQTQWSEFAKKQDELFIEKVPEFADTAQASKLQTQAVEVLKDLGFTEDELVKLWNGSEKISIRDHRLQLLVRESVRLKDAQAKVKEAVKKPVPPVQRPGVGQARGAAEHQQIQNLDKRFSTTGSVKDAAELLKARRKAASR